MWALDDDPSSVAGAKGLGGAIDPGTPIHTNGTRRYYVPVCTSVLYCTVLDKFESTSKKEKKDLKEKRRKKEGSRPPAPGPR